MQITRSVPAELLKALKLAAGDATETTVAAVKSAASFESDCDTVDNVSGRTRMDVMDVQGLTYSQTASIIVTPSSRSTDNNGNQLCHRITCVFCGFILQ